MGNAVKELLSQKTGVSENEECHCLTVVGQAVPFRCGIDGKDTNWTAPVC